MELIEDAYLLKVYLGESDKVGRSPAYKAIVHELRKQGIWGATVTRGVYGFGKRSVLHASSPLRLSEDLPVVIEAVDSQGKLEAAIPKIAPLVRGGLLVLVPVKAYTRIE
jgi:PII-like signaling protein